MISASKFPMEILFRTIWKFRAMHLESRAPGGGFNSLDCCESAHVFSLKRIQYDDDVALKKQTFSKYFPDTPGVDSIPFICLKKSYWRIPLLSETILWFSVMLNENYTERFCLRLCSQSRIFNNATLAESKSRSCTAIRTPCSTVFTLK